MFLYDARLEPSHSSVKRGILAATNLGSACAVVANITAQIESEFLPPWLSCPQKAYETRWQQWTSSLKSAWGLWNYFALHSPFTFFVTSFKSWLLRCVINVYVFGCSSVAPCEQSFLLCSWMRRRKKEAQPEPRQTFWSRRSPNFWTSQSCFLSSNWFIRVWVSVC